MAASFEQSSRDRGKNHKGEKQDQQNMSRPFFGQQDFDPEITERVQKRIN
jgi:hypothetical protein